MPQAIPFIAIALTAASTGYAVQQAQEQRHDANTLADYNKKVADQNANTAAEQSQYEATRIRERNQRLLASQQSSVLKNGFTSSGTALDIYNDSSMQGEMDALAALYTGRVNSGNYLQRGRLAQLEGQNAANAAGRSQVGSLLTGAGNIASAGASYYSRPATAKSQPSFNNGRGDLWG